MTDHERFMARALELARDAADAGNAPFGSLLVLDGEIVAEANNTVATDGDITAHPELVLARQAAREFSERVGDVTMYTSTMPCMMCSGALYIAGVGRVVYSVDGATAARESPGDRPVPTTDYLRQTDRVEVVGPILQSEGIAVHRECWPRE